MLLFLDEYKKTDNMLLETMQCVEQDYKVIVLDDVPFLPHNMISVYEYYLSRYEQSEWKEKDIFYVFLDIPEFWEIRPEGVNGVLFNRGKKVATIYFKEPIEKRNVQRIEWNTEQGSIYKIDYYCKYGFHYCSAYIRDNDFVEAKVYYTSDHKELINVNCSNGVVTLFENGQVVSLFSSVEEFKKAVMKEALDEKNLLVLTSSRQAQWIAESEETNNKKMVIVLRDEKDVKECQWKQYHQRLQCSLFVFQHWGTKECQLDYTKKEFGICYSTTSYPKVIGNADALILTASDHLFGIEGFIESLPEITFHIAAPTLMSEKLMDLSAFANVCLYPQISGNELKSLYETCSFYFDINYGREVDDAVIKASLNNMLIFGYRHFIHNRYYVLEECIFDEAETLVRKIKDLINNRDELEKLTEIQKEKAAETIQHIVE